MELETFIKTTLVNIKNGIRAANIEIAKSEGKELGVDASSIFVMEPNNRDKKEGYITFDVAVTVSQESSKGGGGNIKIAIANLGGEVSDAHSQEHISRIKFNIMPQVYVS